MSTLYPLIESTLVDFTKEFAISPYLSYTEHGLHAQFYHNFINKMSKDQLDGTLEGRKFRIIQKEYPTHSDLGKGQRQHWDIAIIDRNKPPKQKPLYDHMPLLAAIEFGMNESTKHLSEDIRRLLTDDNVNVGYIVHLFRLSDGWSGRDKKPKMSYFVSPTDVQKILSNLPKNKKEIKIFYCCVGRIVDNDPNPCLITNDGINPL